MCPCLISAGIFIITVEAGGTVNRKFRKLWNIWALVPVIIGVALLLVGMFTGTSAIQTVGIVIMFGGSFLFAVIFTVIYIVKGVRERKLSVSDDDDENYDDDEYNEDEYDEDEFGNEITHERKQSATDAAAAALSDSVESSDCEDVHTNNRDSVEITRESEREAIEKINSTYCSENRMAMAEHQLRHISAARNSGAQGKNAKLFGILLIIWLLGAFAGIIICAMFHAMVGVFICMGIFAGTIIICIVVITIRQKISMSDKYYDPTDVRKGEVISCTVSSQTSTGGRHYSRVMSVVYRIAVEVDGEQKVAYSRSVYEAGEEVDVLLNRKFESMVKIVGLSESNFETDDNFDDDIFD